MLVSVRLQAFHFMNFNNCRNDEDDLENDEYDAVNADAIDKKKYAANCKPHILRALAFKPDCRGDDNESNDSEYGDHMFVRDEGFEPPTFSV
jgi:hypothetical protein